MKNINVIFLIFLAFSEISLAIDDDKTKKMNILCILPHDIFPIIFDYLGKDKYALLSTSKEFRQLFGPLVKSLTVRNIRSLRNDYYFFNYIYGLLKDFYKNGENKRENILNGIFKKYSNVKKLQICQINDNETAYLSLLTNLKQITLYYPKISNKGLTDLTKLTTLKSIILTSTWNTFKDLKLFSYLINLTEIALEGSDTVNDDDLICISNLINLHSLDISFCLLISDRAVEHLVFLTKLTSLNFDMTTIGDEGVQYFSRLTNLETLSLSDTFVTDNGIKHLSALMKLKKIDISFCHEITDEGLKCLSHIKNLEIIN